MLTDISSCLNWEWEGCSWNPAGRDEGRCSAPRNARAVPTAENDPAPNVDSTEAEKVCSAEGPRSSEAECRGAAAPGFPPRLQPAEETQHFLRKNNCILIPASEPRPHPCGHHDWQTQPPTGTKPDHPSPSKGRIWPAQQRKRVRHEHLFLSQTLLWPSTGSSPAPGHSLRPRSACISHGPVTLFLLAARKLSTHLPA